MVENFISLVAVVGMLFLFQHILATKVLSYKDVKEFTNAKREKMDNCNPYMAIEIIILIVALFSIFSPTILFFVGIVECVVAYYALKKK